MASGFSGVSRMTGPVDIAAALSPFAPPFPAQRCGVPERLTTVAVVEVHTSSSSCSPSMSQPPEWPRAVPTTRSLA